ncbi:MAG: hypothetical protein D8M58_03665 [Calditrichaeota bacterium]|nr:MAG: hypothetical protein DWQ03_03410 [Calditrichota bacterium]MBL1204464.1 hypothetical protein [Calditrichota bacterium]NOG44293.1 hypothetical protein [Calditrichota bacterium]
MNKILKLKYFVLPIVVLLTAKQSQSQHVFQLSDTLNSSHIGTYLYYYTDSTNSKTIEAVQSPKFESIFIHSQKTHLGFGHTKSAVWLRLDIYPGNINLNRYFIQFEYPMLNHVTMYSIKDSVLMIQESGLDIPLKNRDVESESPTFPLYLSPNRINRFYFKIKSNSSMAINAQIFQKENYYRALIDKKLFLGHYYGLVLVMVLYNLFLAFSTKEKSFLYYAFYAGFQGLYQFHFDGLVQIYAYPNNPILTEIMMGITINGFLLMGLVFCKEYLLLKKNTWLYNNYKVLIFLNIILILILPLLGYYDWNRMAHNFSYLFLIFLTVSSIVRMIDGFKPSKFFVIAVSFFIAGLVIRISRNLGLLPESFFTLYAFHFGSALEMTLLSFGLGDRINRLKDEKDEIRLKTRTRIAADLHDDIGSTLTKISTNSEIIKSAEDSIKIKAAAEKIGNLSREMISSFGDVIWAIDSRKDSMQDLIDRMNDLVFDLFAEDDIHVTFKADTFEPSNLDVEVRQNVYFIYKEALNNICKHAQATKVDIALKKLSNGFELHIKDNGIGIKGIQNKSGNGLKNMKNRAEQIGAKLSINTTRGCNLALSYLY